MTDNHIKVGKWFFDITTGGLYSSSDMTKPIRVLTHKPLLFLRVLYESNGGVVSKDDISDKVWQGYTSTENISQTVNKLRSFFEDKERSVIVNHPSRGYSFNFSKEFYGNESSEFIIKSNNSLESLGSGKLNVLFNVVFPSLIITLSVLLLFFTLRYSNYLEGESKSNIKFEKCQCTVIKNEHKNEIHCK